MMDDKLSRRDVLEHSAALGVLVAFGASACGKEKHALVCTDTTGLATADAQLRQSAAVAYADLALDPSKPCERCLQFIPAPSAALCGACKVVKGPINPKGGCKLFAPKPAV
jgi:hypothetical protein